MNIIFFGSSKHSTIVEEALHKNLGLSLVVTVADKIDSKQKILNPSPVKNFAQINNIPSIASDSLTDDVIKQIASYAPDYLVVADYGLILPKKVLELPKVAPINVHHSLLPKYRGPSPAPNAILAGEKTTGVSIIVMNNKVDAGDILAQEKCTIESTDTTDTLLTKINTLGGTLVCEVIQKFDEYYKHRKIQNEKEATFTEYMEKWSGFIDIKNIPNPETLSRMIRAYFPWPSVWTTYKINNRELRIKLLPNKLIQIEGKKPGSYKDFINGYSEGKELLEKLHLLEP